MQCLPWPPHMRPTCVTLPAPSDECLTDNARCSQSSECCSHACDGQTHRCVSATDAVPAQPRPRIAATTCQADIHGPCMQGGRACCDGLRCLHENNVNAGVCVAVDPPHGACYYGGESCSFDHQCCSSTCDVVASVCRHQSDGKVAYSAAVQEPPRDTFPTVASAPQCQSTPYTSCIGRTTCCAGLVCVPHGSTLTPTCMVIPPTAGKCFSSGTLCTANTHCCSLSCDMHTYTCLP